MLNLPENIKLEEELYSAKYAKVLQDSNVDTEKYMIPKQWIDYINSDSKFIKQMPKSSGPSYIKLCSCSEIRLIEINMGISNEHILKTESFLMADPHVNDPSDYIKYRGKAVDLIYQSSLYFPEGILVWLPEMQIFGSYLFESENLLVFPNSNVEDVINRLDIYINTQWNMYEKDYPVEFGNIWDYFHPSNYYEFVNYSPK